MTHTIENEFLKVEVNTFGAELKSIYNKKTSKEILWQADPQHWARKAPVLFPVIGKLTDNKYVTDGNTYSLTSHGFARDNEFELTEQKENLLKYSLNHNETLLKLYPYKFELLISYMLLGNSITVQYEVKNQDNKTIYFSIGGHPAFNCPLDGNEKLDDYYLEFEKNETASTMLLDAGFVTGESKSILKESNNLPLNEELFKIDTVVFQNLKSSFVRLKNKQNNYSLKFTFKEYPVLAIWKKPGANFVCIEPWQGYGDPKGFKGELKDKPGIVSLNAIQSFKKSYSIEIE